VLGEVPLPDQSLVSGVAILQEKALQCWAFNEALLTMMSLPWFWLMCLAKVVVSVVGLH